MNLGSMTFGSEEFRETAIGQATVTVMADLVGKLAHLVKPRALETGDDGARVLSVFGEEIFIGLGSANGVHPGYRFTVHPSPARAERDGLDPVGVVGVIEILDVIGARISRVRAVGEYPCAGCPRTKAVPRAASPAGRRTWPCWPRCRIDASRSPSRAKGPCASARDTRRFPVATHPADCIFRSVA